MLSLINFVVFVGLLGRKEFVFSFWLKFIVKRLLKCYEGEKNC